jgi:uncharacterized protein (DUF433 family)
MGTPRDDRAAQVETVLDRLAAEYPDATISLDFSTVDVCQIHRSWSRQTGRQQQITPWSSTLLVSET